MTFEMLVVEAFKGAVTLGVITFAFKRGLASFDKVVDKLAEHDVVIEQVKGLPAKVQEHEKTIQRLQDGQETMKQICDLKHAG